MKRVANEYVGILVVGCMCGMASGCVSVGRTSDWISSRVSIGHLGAPVFSDEVSRELVRQTQKLLELQNQDYLVGADDVLEISIFEWEMTEETKTLDFRVTESGVISLPVLGVIPVAGKTLQQTQQLIENELSGRSVLQNPRVAVAVKEYRSRRIAVVGEVHAPGQYAIHQNVTTLMEILTLAGGPTQAAGNVAYVLRNRKNESDALRIVIDLEELFNRGNFALNAVLEGGDTVYVPRAALVYVYGAVRQPGGYPLHGSMRVLEVVALAGGFAAEAAKKRCHLMRRSAGGVEEMVDVNIAAIERGRAPNVFLRDGDVLKIPESPAKNVLYELWDVFRGIFTFTYRLDDN